MSMLEIIAMAKELNLEVEGCTFSWLDTVSEKMGMKDIKNDADVLAMAQTVDFTREVNIYVNVIRELPPMFSDVEMDGGNIRDKTQVDMNGIDDIIRNIGDVIGEGAHKNICISNTWIDITLEEDDLNNLQHRNSSLG